VKNDGFNYVERGNKQVFVSVAFALNVGAPEVAAYSGYFRGRIDGGITVL